MLTTCPECRTTFRLSHAQLEARRGLVRCGYCRAVFNAYDTLLPEFEANLTAAPGTGEASAPAAQAPEWDIPAPVLPESLRRERKEARAPEPEGMAEDDEEAFVLHLSDRVDEGGAGEAPAADAASDLLLSELPLRIEPETRERSALWSALPALFLFLLLAGQLVFFLRGPLVNRLPELRPGLDRACRVVGCRVPLPADPAAIRIEASSLETDPEQPNRAMLRVSLSNRSDQAQQWPHLVLKLTDFQGRPLAQRAFKPADYLAKDRSIANGLAPLSEQEFRLDLDLTGMIASGYEVVAKYP